MTEHLSHWQIEELIIDQFEDPGSYPGSHTGSHTGSEYFGREHFGSHSTGSEYPVSHDHPVSQDIGWQHLAACETCRVEKDRLHAVLRLYRSAVISESSRILTYPHMPAPPRRAISTLLLRWALVPLLLLTAAIPLEVRHERQLHHAAEIARDNLLLQQVVQEVSDSVPQPMESLTHLVMAEGNSTVSGRNHEGSESNER